MAYLTGDGPTDLAVLRGRLSMLVEEIGEHAEALNKERVYPESAQEIADVLYVALGTLFLMDSKGDQAYAGTEAVRWVTAKNNQKTPATHHMSGGKAIPVTQ